MVSQFRDQHNELVVLAEAILAAAGDRDAADLSRLRLSFSRAVTEHCRDEGAAVREAVASRFLSAEIAGKHNRIVMMWRAEVALCNSEWPTSRVVEAPMGFIEKFRPLVDGLRAEVELEDREILSVIEAPRRIAA